MIIGFGKIETETEADIEEEIRLFIEKEYQKTVQTEYGMFTGPFVQIVKDHVCCLAKKSQKESDRYKKAETFPDRYSQFWGYVLGDCNHICVILSFIHINRKHALSSDGWASLQRKVVFDVANVDIKEREKAT